MDEAVFRNITACKEIAQIVRTSFGPNGALSCLALWPVLWCLFFHPSSRFRVRTAAASNLITPPTGMNKMIVNHLDKLFVTNDAATIIRELEVRALCDAIDTSIASSRLR
jgi:T-complex protein 1 subunit theta